MPSTKLAEAPTNGSDSTGNSIADLNLSAAAAPATTPTPPVAPAAPPAIAPWPTFLQTAKPTEIKDRFAQEVLAILQSEVLAHQCWLALIEPEDSINTADLDAIFSALSLQDPDHDKDVVLFLLCRGGSIEPAFQISKICKAFAGQMRFVTVVPRQAKSAATLIAIGADEIHMGPLGHLGPIDPQLDGLPALGVSQALSTIASVAEKHPGSAELFARYLQRVLTVEQVGYCDRISESAVQYAVRLLSTKPALVSKAAAIAKDLVYEYKDHGFVIDIEEARMHLGSDWIKSDTREIRAAERIYSLYEEVSFLLRFFKSKRFYIMGSIIEPGAIRMVKAND